MDKTVSKLNLIKIASTLLLFVKRNYLMFMYILCALIIELTGVAVTSGKFFMTEPWLYFAFLALPCFISIYIKTHNIRYILFIVMLGANFVLDLIFIVIYDSTNTIFDFAMFNLRSDAMVIVESIPLSFTYIFVSATVVSLYCVLGHMLKKYMPDPASDRITVVTTSVLLSLVVVVQALLLYFDNYMVDSNDMSYRLYRRETGTYSNKGIIGNFASEMVRGTWFADIKVGDEDELENFVYAKTTEPTEMFGVAEGYNVVTVLCESLEWFTFLLDEDRYPNGYAKLLYPEGAGDGYTPTDAQRAELSEKLHKLYPNLYRMYESNATAVFNNSHSLEKTDISENKSIIGNYPMYEYINYAYPTNSLPYSLPNIMKELYGVKSRSFHDGFKSFYNREEHHTTALGFDSYTASEDMDVTPDYKGLGERNLDSEMIESCKTEMFPTDRRFNTFITTITQHGQYAFRENLRPYYEKMDALGILPYTKDDEDANALRYYCAAGMDLDKAFGIMFDYLDENGLADKTIVTIFGDHNSYYQGISNYVKNIYSYSAKNYTELYRVPVMMKIGELDLGNPKIEKFTCVADIYPTILDVLGIRGFENLMYGTSAFSDKESILYSRAYDKFITDKIYFNSLDTIIYVSPEFDKQREKTYIAEVEERAITLLDKISHVNRIFSADFLSGSRKTKFVEEFKKIQGM